MSKVFKIGDSLIEFSGDIDAYNAIWKELLLKAQYEITAFKKFYDDAIDIDEVIKSGYTRGIVAIDNVFLSFGNLFIKNGCFDFSAEYLRNNDKFHSIIQPFEEAYNDIEKKVNSLDDYEKMKALEREMAKEHRYKIRGGGFGLAGAAKGIIQAEAINLTTGLVYSGFNLIGNLFTSMSVTETKNDLYQKSKDYLCMCLYKSMVAIMDVLVEELKLGLAFEPDKAEKIINNIENNVIQGDLIKAALNEAIKQNPYNDRIYTKYCLYYNEFEEDIVEIASFFGINLSNYIISLHEYNNYYFKNIWLAYAAKNFQEELNKDFNKMYRYDFSQKMYDNNFWITCTNQELLKYIINAYQNLKNRFKNENIENDKNAIELKKLANISNFDELQDYFDKNINYFKGKLDLLLNTGCCVKSYNSDEFRKALFDLLDKYEIGKKDRNIYLGNYIREEHICEAEQIFGEEVKRYDVYIFIKARNYYGSKDNIFLFTSNGAYFGNNEGQKFIEFGDINEVKVQDNIFSNYDSFWITSKSNPENLISIDDEYIYCISEKGNNIYIKAEYIVKIINDNLTIYKNDKYIKSVNKAHQEQSEKNNNIVEENNSIEFDLLAFIENKYKFLEDEEEIFIGKNIPEDLLNKVIDDYAIPSVNEKPYLLIHSTKYNTFKSMLLCSDGLHIGQYELFKLKSDSIIHIGIQDLEQYGVKYDEGLLNDTICYRDREIYIDISLKKVMSSLANLINALIPIAYFENFKNKSFYEGIYCAIVGDLYKKGKGTKPDLEKAAYSYFKGILLFNDEWCLYEFGHLYFDGLFFKKDIKKAKYWFMRAADVALSKGETENEGVLKNIKNRQSELEKVEPVTEIEAFTGDELNNKDFQKIIDEVRIRRKNEEDYYLTLNNINESKKLAEKYHSNNITWHWYFYPEIPPENIKMYLNEYTLGRFLKYDDILAVLMVDNARIPVILITKWGVKSCARAKCLFCYLDKIVLKNNSIYVNEQVLLKVKNDELLMKNFDILTHMFNGEYAFDNILEEKKFMGINVFLKEITLTDNEILSYVNAYKKILNNGFYWINEFPEKKLKNVLNTYANGFSKDSIIILYDDTILGSAKEGFIVHKFGLKNSKGIDILFSNIKKIEPSFKELNIILKDNTKILFWEFFEEKECLWFTVLLGALLSGEYLYNYESIYPKCDAIEFNIIKKNLN